MSYHNSPAGGASLPDGDSATIQPSRFSLRDLIAEAATAITARPGRAALTVVGIVLGVGTFVAVVGLTNTASGQISARFDALAATTVSAVDARSSPQDPFPFGENADRQAQSLNGVTAAGVVWTVDTKGAPLHSTPIGTAANSVNLPVIAASAGAWGAVDPHLTEGRTFDSFANQRALHVAVLGAGAARSLGITTLVTQPAIFIGDVPFVVIGTFDDTVRAPDLLLAVVIPRGTAEALWGTPDPQAQAAMLVATRPGAAVQVAEELPYALTPQAVDTLSAMPPPDPRGLRDAVTGDLSGLLFSLAAICLFIGAVGIANTTLVAVLERTPEIGLRRAVGARRHHIGSQIVAESAALGTLGGLVGASLGIFVALAVSLAKQWTPVLDPRIVFLAPLIGLAAGAVAGLYPATRAAKIEPTEALRR